MKIELNNKIELINKRYNTDSFMFDYTYTYTFVVCSEGSNLKNHELLTQGFKNDVVVILKDEFGEEIKKYMDKEV